MQITRTSVFPLNDRSLQIGGYTRSMSMIYVERCGSLGQINRNDKDYIPRVLIDLSLVLPNIGSLLLEEGTPSRRIPTRSMRKVKVVVSRLKSCKEAQADVRNHVLLQLRFRQSPTRTRPLHTSRHVFITTSPFCQTCLSSIIQYPRYLCSNARSHSTSRIAIPNRWYCR